MSQTDAVAGGRPIVKGSMAGIDDLELDDDDVVCSLNCLLVELFTC